MSSHEKIKPAAVRRNALLTTAFNKTLIARILISFVLFIASLFIKNETGLRFVLLLFGIIICVGDLVYKTAVQFLNGSFFTTSALILFVVVLAFIAGYRAEALLMCIIHQAGRLVLSLFSVRAKKSALNMMIDSNDRAMLVDIIKEPENTSLYVEEEIKQSVKPLLYAITALGILYAILMPLLAHYNFSIALHRALVLLLIGTPTSMLISIPSVGINGLCFAALDGRIYSSAKSLETLDVDNVLSERPCSSLVLHSDVLDESSFLNFIVHVLCKSEQDFAKFITFEANIPYDSELIEDFEDIQDGVKGTIKGMPVEFVLSGPDEYMLTLGGREVGTLVVNKEGSTENKISRISSRMRSIAIENAFIAFVIKAVLVFLAIIGYTNLWFTVFLELIVGLITIENAKRIGIDSAIEDKFK